MIIDFENHSFMADQVEPISSDSGRIVEHPWDENGMVGTRRFVEASHIDKFLQFMDDAGIDMQVLSLGPGVEQFEASVGTSVAMSVNNELAEVLEEYPERFAGLATIAPQDPDAAASELAK